MIEVKVSDNTLKEETLRIDRHKGIAKMEVRVYRFQDKDSLQFVLFAPSLQLTGYGCTIEKADEMLRFSIEDFLNHLASLRPSELGAELVKLGWKHVPYAKKQYSKAYIDINGELCNFNALENKV